MNLTARPLPFGIKVAYALPAFALAAVGIPVYLFIPKFYTDVVGVNITVVGYLLFGVRIFDALTDPWVGWWSDRHASKLGRRRPFILGGAALLAIAVFFLFTPPAEMAAWIDTLWFGFWIYTLFLFWTITAVPYESLGPELTRDYNDRTTLFALRDGLLIAGTLVAAAAPALVKGIWGMEDGAQGEREMFSKVALLYIPILLGTCAVCVYLVREREVVADGERLEWRESLRLVRRNRPFLILLAAFTISALGSNLPAALILFYIQYVLGAAEADFFLLAYFVTGIAFLPLWIRMSGRIGKKNTWLIALAINFAGSLAIFFLRPGDIGMYGALVVVSGIGLGPTLALPSALQADVIDYDELISGRRREGQYMGMWSIAKKLSAAVGVGAGMAVLGMAGYVPNAEQSETVRWVIRCFYALIPALCHLIALVIVLPYPLDSDIHGKIIQGIDALKTGRTVTDPLKPDMALCRNKMT